MKKLRKKVNESMDSVEAYCSCGECHVSCYCSAGDYNKSDVFHSEFVSHLRGLAADAYYSPSVQHN